MTSQGGIVRDVSLGSFHQVDSLNMKYTCERPECELPAPARLCAFHNLEVSILQEVFEMAATAVEATPLAPPMALFDEMPLCRHDGAFGACYLTTDQHLPGFGSTPWELRAAVYSQGIPLN